MNTNQLDPLGSVLSYFKLPLSSPANLTQAIELRLALEERLKPLAKKLTSCHNDFHHYNMVESDGRLRVIDWKYAGPGDPYYYLAVFANAKKVLYGRD